MATLGGNLMQRPRCWYFRSSDFDCKKKGDTSDACHAHAGENQYHAIMNNSTCAMVHPSSTAVPLLAMNAQVELTSKQGKRTVAINDFYVSPEKSLVNETVLKPGELITAVFVPAPASGTRSAYQKYGEKESFDWPIADAGVVLVMDGNTCRQATVALVWPRRLRFVLPQQRICWQVRRSTKLQHVRRPRPQCKAPRRYHKTVIRCSSFKLQFIARYCWLQDRWTEIKAPSVRRPICQQTLYSLSALHSAASLLMPHSVSFMRIMLN